MACRDNEAHKQESLHVVFDANYTIQHAEVVKHKTVVIACGI